jgi:hypothetical protein
MDFSENLTVNTHGSCTSTYNHWIFRLFLAVNGESGRTNTDENIEYHGVHLALLSYTYVIVKILISLYGFLALLACS